MSRPSNWMGVVCDGERSRSAVRSWFGAMVPDDWDGPFKADILTDPNTDREKKMRALFRRPDGALREVSRTLGSRQFTIRVGVPSKAVMVGFHDTAATQTGDE